MNTMAARIFSLLENCDRAFITTHVHPDGDAAGSQWAWGRFLEKLGKRVTMLNSDPVPANLRWISGMERVEVFTGSLAQRRQIAEADILFVVDTNSRRRLGKIAGAVCGAPGLKVLIDHHTYPEDWFDVQHVCEEVTSTGELMYALITDFDADIIDTEIATALYAAISTDTGCFRYGGITPRVHRIAADLIERGAFVPEHVHGMIYDRQPVESLHLFGCVLDTMVLLGGGRLAYMVITRRMLEKTGAGSEDAEGFVNAPLSIEGVDMAVLFLETAKGTKVSFRSRGETPVHIWARTLGGGGHRNAAGAFLNQPLDAAIERVLRAAPDGLAREEEDGDEPCEEDVALLASFTDIRSEEP